MKITVNGETKELTPESEPHNLQNVLTQLGHNLYLVVVEFNGVILPRQDWEQQQIKDGDRLEIVTIVGGGS